MSLSDHVVESQDVCGGKPRLAGTRVRVQDVALLSESGGLSPDQIAREFTLTLAQVHAALAYYFDHIEQIRKDIAEQDLFVATFQHENPSRLASKTRRDLSA